MACVWHLEQGDREVNVGVVLLDFHVKVLSSIQLLDIPYLETPNHHDQGHHAHA